MGHRCNLVIIENNQTIVYYDHWAANHLDVELLWGPEIARKFIEEREPRPDSWLDDTWAEGGCVIDFDAQHLLWYGGQGVLLDPQQNLIHRELIKSQWEDWTIEWANDGIFDIARKAGVPIDVVTSDHQPDESFLTLPYIHENEFFYADSVISYLVKGDLKWAVLKGDVDSLANIEMTPDAIADLVRRFSITEFEKGKLLDPEWGSIKWGAHFDFDTFFLEYWTPDPCEGLQALVEQRLSKWSVVNHGPNYQWHEILVPSKEWPEITLQKKMDYLEMCRRTLTQNNINPLVNVLNRMTAEGQKNIQVNPDAWQRRKGNQELLEVKNSILDNLEREIKRQ